MSRNPPAAKNSASASVETVIGPKAPPCCIRAPSIVLCVFTCGRKITPDARAFSRMRMQLSRRRTMSTRKAGVDSSVRIGISTATETAEVIRREIRAETNLTASAGVAPNKFLAKIASDWRKPDGCFVIRPHQVERFLIPLPVRKIPGVGKATEKVLHEMKIETVGDLHNFSQEELVARFGKWGTRLWELARGIDESPAERSRRRR